LARRHNDSGINNVVRICRSFGGAFGPMLASRVRGTAAVCITALLHYGIGSGTVKRNHETFKSAITSLTILSTSGVWW
jgi:hypothetical protein